MAIAEEIPNQNAEDGCAEVDVPVLRGLRADFPALASGAKVEAVRRRYRHVELSLDGACADSPSIAFKPQSKIHTEIN
jgi:hypothetical protein